MNVNNPTFIEVWPKFKDHMVFMVNLIKFERKTPKSKYYLKEKIFWEVPFISLTPGSWYISSHGKIQSLWTVEPIKINLPQILSPKYLDFLLKDNPNNDVFFSFSFPAIQEFLLLGQIFFFLQMYNNAIIYLFIEI